ECRRNVLERAVDYVALSRERPGNSPQLLDGGDDVVPLRIKASNEVVEAGKQLANLGFTSGQRGVEVVDDVTDLPQPARVDDRREGRQRLFGGGIGRRLVQADGGSGLQSAAWLFTERWIERQVHGSQQAGLPDRGYRVGGHHNVGLDGD